MINLQSQINIAINSCQNLSSNKRPNIQTIIKIHDMDDRNYVHGNA